MLATVTNLLRHHVPAAEALVAGDDAIRHHWEALLATATSPAERDEINDVFGRAIR